MPVQTQQPEANYTAAKHAAALHAAALHAAALHAGATDAAAVDAAAVDASWQRPAPTPAGLRRDALVAAVLVAATAGSAPLFASVTPTPTASFWVTAVWVVLIAAPLAARRRWPAIVALVIAVVFITGQIVGVPEQLFCNITLFVAIYSLGAWGRNRRIATVVRLTIIVGMFVWLFGALFVRSGDPQFAQFGGQHSVVNPFLALAALQVIQNLLYFAAAYYFGNTAWASARGRAVLEQRTNALAVERERSQRQAVALERVRIARELHDVVAHHVSVMGVQAGAARRVLEKAGEGPDARPDAEAKAQALRSVAAIEQNARSAVDDLHRLLGALRDPGADPAAESASAAASTRGIPQLPELVGESVQAGVAVSFQVVGEPRPVAATTSLNVYRITQEALTNCRKHAGAGARVDARLRYLDDAVEIEVSDSGGAGGGSAGTGAGAGAGARLGQLGMRERVSAAGGQLELGPKPRGGYVVRARFPLAPAEERVPRGDASEEASTLPVPDDRARLTEAAQ